MPGKETQILIDEAILDKPPRPVRRVAIGINVALQVLLLLAVCFVLNYLSCRHYKRWDLSYNSDYTLSGATSQFLDRMEDDMEIVVAFVGGSPIRRDVETLVEELQRQSKGKLKTLFVDPARDPDTAEEIKLEYGAALDSNSVIIRKGEQTKFVDEQEMVFYEPGKMGEQPRVEFHGEDALLSAMVAVSEGSQKTIYVLAGKGQLPVTNGQTAFHILEELTRKQNARLMGLSLSDAEGIPEDADTIAILGAQYDLTEREDNLIRDYWKQDRGSILILLNPEGQTPRLHAFLNEYGIRPRNDRVLYAESTGAGPVKEFRVQATFVPGISLATPFLGTTTTFGGQSQSLAVAENDQSLAERTIEVHPVLEASRRYWGETDYFDKLPTLDSRVDQQPPVFVAASCEYGAVADERLRVDSSRMIVVGNDTLLDPAYRIPSNYDFISSSLNWMLDREELIGIPPKDKRVFTISITPEQHSSIFWLIAVTLPASVLAFGFFIWTLRRQ